MLAKEEVLSLDSRPMKKFSEKYDGPRHHYDGRAANKVPDRERKIVPPVVRSIGKGSKRSLGMKEKGSSNNN